MQLITLFIFEIYAVFVAVIFAPVALKFVQKCDFRSHCPTILTSNFAPIALKIEAPGEHGYQFLPEVPPSPGKLVNEV